MTTTPHVTTTQLIAGALTIGLLAGCDLFDPDFSEFQGFDFSCDIPNDRIFSVLDRDAIAALTSPETVPASAADFLGDDDRVLGVVINGEARAYPFGVLWWHEVVNDSVGGRPIVVSYCPLTGSGIVFDARPRGRLRNFGVSGLLFENNLIMFDRQSFTLWNQMSLRANCGPDRGASLDRLPIVESTWGRWRALYPESRVMTANTGWNRNYFSYPYGSYANPGNPTQFVRGSLYRQDRPPKELVLGIFNGDDALAFPFGVLEDEGDSYLAVNESLNGIPVLVTYHAASQTAQAFVRRTGGQVLTMSVADVDATTLIDSETGTIWNAVGDAVSGPLAGRRLPRLDDAYVAFWFAWAVYYPTIRIVE